jgi:orotidine-5'-phosphate decarboxylase
MKTCSSPIIVVLDYPNAASAWKLVNQLTPELCRLKVGKELFVAAGPDFVRQLVAKGFDVFLDLKFYDIPNTVAHACVAAANLGVWMINVHCSGGTKMMQAARQAIDQQAGHKPLLIGVTVLTSMVNDDLSECGVNKSTDEQVLDLAELAYQSGLDGVVCSANEAKVLRAKFGKDFCLVTPGIRFISPLVPSGAQVGEVAVSKRSEDRRERGSREDDQQRVMTPKAATLAGSDYLVIGRPITQCPDPLQALNDIIKSI